jgi:hypothetical protein
MTRANVVKVSAIFLTIVCKNFYKGWQMLDVSAI